MTTQRRESKQENTFNYLLNRIKEAEFNQDPFKHIEITEFLKEEHFERIVGLDVINTTGENDRSIINSIQRNGYEHVSFPGTFSSVDEYISYRNGDKEQYVSDTLDSAGIVFRLTKYDDPILKDLFEFFASEEFLDCVCEKFELPRETFDADLDPDQRETVGLDTGLQKYLDGYEISPHPDSNRKALTWMLNLNPSHKSEEMNHHTHYLNFKDKKKYIEKYWEYNPETNRCWVPWDWCETAKRQTENNSIVIFSPSYDTLHAVKADYDHYETQRTQFYGNLWYDCVEIEKNVSWEDFVIEADDEIIDIHWEKISGAKSKAKVAAKNPLMAINKLLE